jgi:hypothetical protein
VERRDQAWNEVERVLNSSVQNQRFEGVYGYSRSVLKEALQTPRNKQSAIVKRYLFSTFIVSTQNTSQAPSPVSLRVVEETQRQVPSCVALMR